MIRERYDGQTDGRTGGQTTRVGTTNQFELGRKKLDTKIPKNRMQVEEEVAKGTAEALTACRPFAYDIA